MEDPVPLLVVLVSLVVDDVVELELVDTAGGGHDAQPVAKLLLLEELLGPVFTCALAYQIFQFEASRLVRAGGREVGGLCIVQVLEVAAGEINVGDDLDLAIALLGDDDVLAQVVGATLDLDAVLEELLESRDVKDLVVGGLRSIDDELARGGMLVLLPPRRPPETWENSQLCSV